MDIPGLAAPGGDVQPHEIVPEHRQDAGMRLKALADEMLRHHEYPEDVILAISGLLKEWESRWNARGVRRGATFSELAYRELPMVVKDQMNVAQQAAARSRGGGDLLAPGRRAD